MSRWQEKRRKCQEQPSDYRTKFLSLHDPGDRGNQTAKQKAHGILVPRCFGESGRIDLDFHSAYRNLTYQRPKATAIHTKIDDAVTARALNLYRIISQLIHEA